MQRRRSHGKIRSDREAPIRRTARVDAATFPGCGRHAVSMVRLDCFTLSAVS